jgi:SAM-dependent methyltransferase
MQDDSMFTKIPESSTFKTEVESEAIQLIRSGTSPYDAMDRARRIVSNRSQLEGENPTLRDYSILHKMLCNYDPSIVNRQLSPNDTMKGENYFSVGTSAVEVIISACIVSQLTNVSKVLDLPCGHGRVLRHLVTLFPDAQIDACDLDQDGLKFCASTFNIRPILSCEELTEVRFDSTYDIIWIGSLFTHTSYDVTKRWLTFLSGLLTPQGIIIATIHGRWASQLHRLVPYIDDKSWKVIIKDYEKKGYGYHDYKVGQSHDFISGSYGISVAKPHTIIKILEDIPGTRIYLYQEKAWGKNHDVIVFGHPDWDESWW